mmetsp:Transcript_61505/g.138443  ORF Transcript_61505/g.138443 Transcript_61505/m.138443 type:complete len:332 (+) Transcript_61505:862-1857(+)
MGHWRSLEGHRAPAHGSASLLREQLQQLLPAIPGAHQLEGTAAHRPRCGGSPPRSRAQLQLLRLEALGASVEAAAHVRAAPEALALRDGAQAEVAGVALVARNDLLQGVAGSASHRRLLHHGLSEEAAQLLRQPPSAEQAVGVRVLGRPVILLQRRSDNLGVAPELRGGHVEREAVRADGAEHEGAVRPELLGQVLGRQTVLLQGRPHELGVGEAGRWRVGEHAGALLHGRQDLLAAGEDALGCELHGAAVARRRCEADLPVRAQLLGDELQGGRILLHRHESQLAVTAQLQARKPNGAAIALNRCRDEVAVGPLLLRGELECQAVLAHCG